MGDLRMVESKSMTIYNASRHNGVQRLVKGGAFYLLMFVLAILWMVPVVFSVFTAVKSPQELATHGVFSIPTSIDWNNFVQAWTVGDMSIYMKNSLLITVIKVPLGILIESLAAFGLTRLNFRFSKSMFVLFLVGFMIPMQATLIPLNIMLIQTHLINTYFALIVIYIAFGLPFGILVLRGFFRQIPFELNEAAQIDGCTTWGLYWRVIMPLSLPAIATLVIFDFLATWNEFLLVQTFITSNSMKTLPSGLLNYTTQFSTNYSLVNAGVLISIVPVLMVYLIFQRYFVSGLAGSIKG